MNAFTPQATPGPLFYRGLGFGLLAGGGLWFGVIALARYLF
jgi:hypothetical protein